jgi:uncharacterized membrane protein
MAMLSVWKFPTADGANQMLGTLESLQRQQLINVHDAAIVTWPAGKKKPKTRQLHHLAGAGALTGAFWGLLFGLLFFIPIFGMAVGAALGAWSTSMSNVGITDDFIKRVKGEVTPGTSALFLYTSGGVPERLQEALKGTNMTLITTNLTPEQEAKLRAAFTEEEATSSAGGSQ